MNGVLCLGILHPLHVRTHVLGQRLHAHLSLCKMKRLLGGPTNTIDLGFGHLNRRRVPTFVVGAVVENGLRRCYNCGWCWC